MLVGYKRLAGRRLLRVRLTAHREFAYAHESERKKSARARGTRVVAGYVPGCAGFDAGLLKLPGNNRLHTFRRSTLSHHSPIALGPITWHSTARVKCTSMHPGNGQPGLTFVIRGAVLALLSTDRASGRKMGRCAAQEAFAVELTVAPCLGDSC